MGILKTALKSLSGSAALLAAGGGAARAAGLPQLDVSTYPPQLIWLAITFIALYLLMSRISLPGISQVLEERRHKISDNLKKAEILKEEAQAAADAYETALGKARAEAHSIMLETHDRIAEKAALAKAGIDTELEADIKAAEASIAAARESAMAGLAQVAAEVALSAAEKLSGESLNEKDVAGVIETVMEERR